MADPAPLAHTFERYFPAVVERVRTDGIARVVQYFGVRYEIVSDPSSELGFRAISQDTLLMPTPRYTLRLPI
ncbi:MAG: hypothetical protein V9G98_08945 [Candidatus Competibacter sp.]